MKNCENVGESNQDRITQEKIALDILYITRSS